MFQTSNEVQVCRKQVLVNLVSPCPVFALCWSWSRFCSLEENQQPRKRFTVGQIKKALTLWDTKYANDRNGLLAALKREHGIKVSTSTLTDWKKRKLEYLACPADDLKALRKAKHPGMETELARHIERSKGLPVTSQQACIHALSFVKASDPASLCTMLDTMISFILELSFFMLVHEVIIVLCHATRIMFVTYLLKYPVRFLLQLSFHVACRGNFVAFVTTQCITASVEGLSHVCVGKPLVRSPIPI